MSACEVCDRPKALSATDIEEGRCFRRFSANERGGWRVDCESHRVDWRARALDRDARLADLQDLYDNNRRTMLALVSKDDERLATAEAAARAAQVEVEALATARDNALANVVEWTKRATADRAAARAAGEKAGRLESLLRLARSGLDNAWSLKPIDAKGWEPTDDRPLHVREALKRIDAALAHPATEAGGKSERHACVGPDLLPVASCTWPACEDHCPRSDAFIKANGYHPNPTFAERKAASGTVPWSTEHASWNTALAEVIRMSSDGPGLCSACQRDVIATCRALARGGGAK